MNLRTAGIRFGLEALYFTGAWKLFGPLSSGIGTIFTLHHVRPASADAFQPNALLEIEPAFLETLIEYLRYKKVDMVSLAEAKRRLREQDYERRFVCFTLDDGYRDNLEHAYPIFKKHGVPAALFIATSFPDKLGLLWWLALERAIAATDRLAIEMNGNSRFFDCATPAQSRIPTIRFTGGYAGWRTSATCAGSLPTCACATASIRSHHAKSFAWTGPRSGYLPPTR